MSSALVNTQKEIKNLKTFSTTAERFEGSHLYVQVVLTQLL